MPAAAVVVLAAGAGTRMGGERNKVLLELDGVPVLAWSVRTAVGVPGVARVLVVARSGEVDDVEEALASRLPEGQEVAVVVGGATRHDSEWAALRVLRTDIEAGAIDVVAIHDGARPLAPTALFSQVLAIARECGGAVPAVPAVGLLGPDGPVSGAVAVQTPQAFRAADLLEAYALADHDGFVGTDTAACLERYRPEVVLRAVDGSPSNPKITLPGDLESATRLQQRLQRPDVVG